MYLFGLSNNVLLLTLNRNMEMRAQMRMKKRTQRKRYLRNISMPDYAPPHVHQNARLNTEELEQMKIFPASPDFMHAKTAPAHI
jgi:hypothetical protein